MQIVAYQVSTIILQDIRIAGHGESIYTIITKCYSGYMQCIAYDIYSYGTRPDFMIPVEYNLNELKGEITKVFA